VPAVRPLPRTGSVFVDARGGDRALRVAWHDEADLVVVSLWHGNVCTGTFRLASADVPDLIDTLVDALRHKGTAPVADAG
jgi:hypothetical protein